MLADVLTVTGLVTADPDTVAGALRALAAGGPAGLDAWTRAALSVGARAISTAGATAGLDDVADRVARLADTVTDAAARSAETVRAAVTGATGPGGTISASVSVALAGLAADVDRMLVGEDAPLRLAVGKAVRVATDDAAAQVSRALAENRKQMGALMSPADPAGPVRLLRDEVLRTAEQTQRTLGEQLSQVRELLAAAQSARTAMALTAVKGQPFEDACVAALIDVAAPGDLIEGTGTAAGADGGRKGDAVITVSAGSARGLAGVRVAVECKDSRLSPAALARELDAAAANRGAAAALGVVRAGRMPGSTGVLVLGPQRLVVEYEPGGDTALLRAAVHLIRAAAVERALADAAPHVDRAALAAAVRQALVELDEFQKVDRALAAARRGLDDLARAVELLRSRLTATLNSTTKLLGEGAGISRKTIGPPPARLPAG